MSRILNICLFMCLSISINSTEVKKEKHCKDLTGKEKIFKFEGGKFVSEDDEKIEFEKYKAYLDNNGLLLIHVSDGKVLTESCNVNIEYYDTFPIKKFDLFSKEDKNDNVPVIGNDAFSKYGDFRRKLNDDKVLFSRGKDNFVLKVYNGQFFCIGQFFENTEEDGSIKLYFVYTGEVDCIKVKAEVTVGKVENIFADYKASEAAKKSGSDSTGRESGSGSNGGSGSSSGTSSNSSPKKNKCCCCK